jgi:hypothetical protein
MGNNVLKYWSLSLLVKPNNSQSNVEGPVATESELMVILMEEYMSGSKPHELSRVRMNCQLAWEAMLTFHLELVASLVTSVMWNNSFAPLFWRLVGVRISVFWGACAWERWDSSRISVIQTWYVLAGMTRGWLTEVR